MLAMDGVEQLQAVDARHPQVGDHSRGALHRNGGKRGFATFCRADPIAGGRETQADQLEQVRVVIDQKDVTGTHCVASIPIL